MNGRQEQVLSSVDSACVFFENLKTDVPEIVAARDELRAARADIAKLNARQSVANIGIRGRGLRNLRRDLRVGHLLRIRKRGRVLLKGLPGIEDSLRVPHDRAPNQELIAAAQRIADAVRSHAAAFHRVKFPKDFIRRLERAAQALAKAVDAPFDDRSNRPLATVLLRTALRDARLVVDSLDGLMAAHYPHTSIELKAWRKAKRVRPRIGRPRKRTVASRKPLHFAE